MYTDGNVSGLYEMEGDPMQKIALGPMLARDKDRVIISTAIPCTYTIDEFTNAYMLTNAALQLLHGRMYKFYNTLSVFCAIVLFEIGSTVCGAAPTSAALVIRWIIAGTGSADLMAGAMQILVFVAPLEEQPIYARMLSRMFAVAAVISPVLAASFTERVSW
ncbi:hypothetical protein N7492_002585 [Penicillium capsulatum]|uniref:Major facilitator superfamily (MFS) profile domain-containing protein n=1 Tax=Penicillium capsulatum TaxID=69766 RepID=A0A9W9IIU9_9EURO|nr:hypothetical protein N7492_002585 [Penicillium capsulatum]KAJ6122814.1 hypothetical protein N7512_005279 [Penicillium capsulatum]